MSQPGMLQVFPAKLPSGRDLNRSKVVKEDSQIIKVGVVGNGIVDEATGAPTISFKFAARIQGSIAAPVIQKASATAGEIPLNAFGLSTVEAYITLVPADTAALTPGTVLEYDIEASFTVVYGDDAAPTTETPFVQTIERGMFTVVDSIA